MTPDSRDKNASWAAWGVHLISEVEANASGLDEINHRLLDLIDEVHKLQSENAVLRATITAENVTARLNELTKTVQEFVKEQDKLNTRSALISNVGTWIAATVVAAIVSAIVSHV